MKKALFIITLDLFTHLYPLYCEELKGLVSHEQEALTLYQKEKEAIYDDSWLYKEHTLYLQKSKAKRNESPFIFRSLSYGVAISYFF